MSKKLFKKLSLPLVAVSGLASQSAFAIDDATVTAAQTAGATSVGVATDGTIAIVAVVVGLMIVIGVMRKV